MEDVRVVVERLGVCEKLSNGAVAILFGFLDHSIDAHRLEDNVSFSERLVKTFSWFVFDLFAVRLWHFTDVHIFRQLKVSFS